MNRRSVPLFLAITCFLLFRSAALAQFPTPTYGWNLGNTLEPPSGEGAWGPAATQAQINAVADAGFNVIRLPVAWDSHANQSTYVIDPAWIARVKQVVDWCYARNLTVVVNCHWDGGWLENHIGASVDATINTKMQSYWTQIATAFAAYDHRLLFAGANEPNCETAAQWTTLRSYYNTFISAVRATGGQNTDRWLVIQGPNTSIDLSDQLVTSLPDDSTPGRLVFEIHHYPYQWTLMTADAAWGKMFYFWGQGYHSTTMLDRNSTWGEEAYTDEQFQKMATKFVTKGVPVIIGEWGAVKRTGYSDLTGAELTRHLAARTYFSKYVTDKANALGLKPIWWDAGDAGKNTMWLFDRNTAAVIDPDNIRALTGGPALLPNGDIAAVAPAILSQPADQTVLAGNPVSFSVSVTGTAPLTYQWFKGTAAIAAATASSYTIPATAAADAGSYSVTITNSAGSATSNPATLTVNAAPAMTLQPMSQTIIAGSAVTFTTAASGSPTPTYQWQKSGTDIPGATNATYTIASTQASDQGNYTVVATNSVGSAASNAATLTLTVPTTFDVTGYYARNADIAAAFGNDSLGAWLHFYHYGLAEGRQFDSQFIVSEYLLLNTDLTNAIGADKQAALLHWLTWGKPIEDRIGRVPIGFNVDSYLARYPDLQAAFGAITPTAQRNVTVWNHYVDYGVREGRSDGDFEAYNYLATNSDLAAGFGNDVEAAAWHWYFYGRREGRRIPGNFDVNGYRSRNPDVVVVWGNDLYGCWLHYRDVGVYENRVFDDLLRVLEYRARYADVQTAYGNDLAGVLNHWLFYGKPEGRLGRNP